MMNCIPNPVRWTFIAIFLSTVACYFSSCSKSIDNGQLNSSVANIQKMSREQQRVAYQLLTANERCEIWKLHLETMLNRPNLRDDQFNYVRTVVNYLTPQLFSDVHNESSRAAVSSLRSQGERFFTTEDLYSLLATLDEVTLHTENEGFVDGNEKCTCSSSSDWCEGLKVCKKNSEACELDKNCGTFWLYECDGKCK